MTERKLLELAPGLEWATAEPDYALGGVIVHRIDSRGDVCASACVDPDTLDVRLHETCNLDPNSSMPHNAIIALLHRAGLLDELMCAVWSMAIARAVVQLRNHGSDGCASLVDELHAQNPYLPRKGES